MAGANCHVPKALLQFRQRWVINVPEGSLRSEAGVSLPLEILNEAKSYKSADLPTVSSPLPETGLVCTV
jgi:hypothetical protein